MPQRRAAYRITATGRSARRTRWPPSPSSPGMTLTIEGTRVEAETFAVCESHAARVAQLVDDALRQAMRRHRSRVNLAPGDAEWNEYFGDDR